MKTDAITLMCFDFVRVVGYRALDKRCKREALRAQTTDFITSRAGRWGNRKVFFNSDEYRP